VPEVEEIQIYINTHTHTHTLTQPPTKKTNLRFAALITSQAEFHKHLRFSKCIWG